MEQITVQNLERDTRVAFDSDPDIQAMVKREAELVAEISTFDEAIKSTREELAVLRKRLRPLKRRAGLHKTNNQLIIEFVRDNPGCSYNQISSYMTEARGSNTSAVYVKDLLDKKFIVFKGNDSYEVGSGPIKRLHGSQTKILFEFARSVEWFRIRDLSEWMCARGVPFSSNNINNTIRARHKDKFEIDSNERILKFRLRDEYRNKDLGV